MSHGVQRKTRTSLIACAAAMLFASQAGFAEEPTTLNVYGLLDVGVMSVSGYAGGRRNEVASGVMSGSRWGLRGNEDLGGGWRALFTVEGRIEADTGRVGNRPASGSQLPARLYSSPSPAQSALQRAIAENTAGAQAGVNLAGNSFDRQAFVGLVTPVGAILAGRQYTPAFEVGAQFEAFGTDSFLTPGQIASLPAGLENRANNALAYRIELGPWSGSAMLALGEVPGSSSAGNLWGIRAVYSGERWAVGMGHNARKTQDDQDGLRSTVLGARFKLGPGVFFVSGMKIKEDNPFSAVALRAAIPTLAAGAAPLFPVGTPSAAVTAAVSASVEDLILRLRQDAMLYHLGVQWPLGAGQVIAVYNRLNDKTSANADVASFGAAYVYPLSKRTDVSFIAGRYDNNANAQAAPGGGGFLGGVTEAPGTDSTAVALSLRHRF
jgi:predicted porin